MGKWKRSLTLAAALLLVVTLVLPVGTMSAAHHEPPLANAKAFRLGDQLHTTEKVDLRTDRERNRPVNHLYDLHSKDTANVIVELQSEPLAVYRTKVKGEKGVTAQQRKLEQEQKTFAALAKKAGAQVNYRYDTVFNGYALTVPVNKVDQLLSFQGVKAIYPDHPVKSFGMNRKPNHPLQANVNPSREVIGAGTFWAEGYQGKGIKVGIIDTGVDYHHPDLRHAFDAAYKGRNFVRKDPGSDPLPRDMANETHGTHVAGIIAGRGEQANGVQGVAPGATLYAYRVLDSQGDGRESDVIAAIQQAVTDRLDVINLSLGVEAFDNEQTAIAKAVNQAAVAGVVPVVANGNTGPKTYTANAPATAEMAIAVGATDGVKAVADFSSRGPSQPGLAVKPDVVAPGVGIVSAIPGGKYAAMDGTSMASPHVAGAVALMLETYQDVYPEAEKLYYVKAQLMNSARALQSDPLTAQGAGVVDLSEAAQAKAVAIVDGQTQAVSHPPQPYGTGSLSYGKLAPGQTAEKTVTVKDLAGETQQYDVRVSDAGPVKLRVKTGTTATVPANGSSAALRVEAQVPQGAKPGEYEGRVTLTERSSNRALHLPVSVYVPGGGIDFPPGLYGITVTPQAFHPPGTLASIAFSVYRTGYYHLGVIAYDEKNEQWGDDIAGWLLGEALDRGHYEMNAFDGTVYTPDGKNIKRLPRGWYAIVAFGVHPDNPDKLTLLSDEVELFAIGDAPEDPGDDPGDAPGPIKVNRVAGKDRYATSIALSQHVKNQSLDAVILASGRDFPDALAGGPLVKSLNGTVLLIDPQAKQLDKSLVQTIKRVLKPKKRIVLLGGTKAIPARVEQQLKDTFKDDYTIGRLSGRTRVETAVAIANELAEQPDRVFLASGNHFADALSIVPYANKSGIPILLNWSGKGVDESVKSYLKSKKITMVTIIGGPDAVPEVVLKDLKGMGITVDRAAGKDRFETALEVVKRYYPKASATAIANGMLFPDALSASRYTYDHDLPILLTRPEQLAPDVQQYMKQSNIEDITIIGGPIAVSDQILDFLKK